MKTRRVVVTLELETDLTLSYLRPHDWQEAVNQRFPGNTVTVKQVQVNVQRGVSVPAKRVR